MFIREKKHRLPGEFYVGKISVAFTVCIKNNARLFINPEIIPVFTDILASVTVIEVRRSGGTWTVQTLENHGAL